MSATSHIHRGALAAAAAVAALVFAAAAPARASYGWPIKPFHQQHAIRGYFGDPRIAGHDEAHGTLHFGIDISAPNGTPVYATIDGVAAIMTTHRDTVTVSAGGGVVHEYWHVVPKVVTGQRVHAYRTVVGLVEAPWEHVHFSERYAGWYVNPLRAGALTPYSDRTQPRIHRISFERDGVPAGSRVSGTIDVVSEGFDRPAIAPPAPWNAVTVTPALVEWKLLPARALLSSRTWRVAADFRLFLPRAPFDSVYARWTRQNHADQHRFGRYRFLLIHGLDTRALPNGRYRVVVRAVDTRGNATESSRTVTVANDV